MADLKTLESMMDMATFFGDDLHHLPDKIIHELSPGRYASVGRQAGMAVDCVFEILFSPPYNVTAINQGTKGSLVQMSQQQFNSFNRHGFLSNCLHRDPRYILKFSKNQRQIQPDVYEMILDDKDARETAKGMPGLLPGMEQVAEIYFENDFIKKLIVKNRNIKTRKEQIFAEMAYRK
ncbi:MAG: hypothetical protein WC852_05850 [Candidatus Nanoarchaeia archaeon]|jgi:hypothetical protein